MHSNKRWLPVVVSSSLLLLCLIGLYLAQDDGGSLPSPESGETASRTADAVSAIPPADTGNAEVSRATPREVPAMSSPPWPRPGTIFGVVSDLEGAPVVAAEVAAAVLPEDQQFDIVVPSAKAIRAEAVTGEAGRFEVEVPSQLLFDVTARKADVGVAFGQAFSGERIDLTLQAGARLSVAVESADGEPLGDAAVRVVFAGAAMFARDGETHDRGQVELSELPAGAARLRVDHEEHVPFRERIELADGETLTVDVRLESGVLVFGTVRNEVTGEPIPRALVERCDGIERGVHADPEGGYVLGGIPVGSSFGIRASAPGFARDTRYQRLKGPAEEREIDLLLKPERTISGRVVDKAGPLEGARVVAVGRHVTGGYVINDGDYMETDANGEFRIGSLRSDVYHVVLVTCAGHARVRNGVPPGIPDVSLGDVVLGEALTLAGTVIDRFGKVIPDLDVELSDRQDLVTGPTRRGRCANPLTTVDAARKRAHRTPSSMVSSAFQTVRSITSDDGSFRFEGLSPGTFRVSVTGGGFVPTAVDVEVDEGMEPIDIRLVRGGSVEGFVRDQETGSGIPNATVTLKWTGTEQGDSSSQYKGDRTRSDELGRFRLAGIPPGELNLRADHRDFVAVSKDVLLSEDQLLRGPLILDFYLEGRGRAAWREVEELAKGLGWSSEETALVAQVYARTSSEKKREEGVREALGEEAVEAIRKQRLEVAFEEARGQVGQRIQRLLALEPAVAELSREDKSFLESSLENASVDVLRIFYTPPPFAGDNRDILEKALEAMRERQDRQQAIADRLKARLVERLEGRVGSALIERVCEDWGREAGVLLP